jgi:hypothetical protein
MNPSVTRSLGATAPTMPNAEEGTIEGNANEAPATSAALLKN